MRKYNKIIGYCRVSTKGQLDGYGLEVQEEAILSHYPTAKIYKEQYTGSKADRPEFTKMLEELEEGTLLVVPKLDRLARNLLDGVKVIKDLIDRGVDIHVLDYGYVENTPQGRMMVNMMLTFAEYERELIINRMADGKKVAKKLKGSSYKEGRPRKVDDQMFMHIIELKKSGKTYDDMAKLTGLGRNTIARYLREARELGLI